jgi:hypothetical protein
VWLVVLVGLPIWWRTTTVYRADLHVDRVNAAAELVVSACSRPTNAQPARSPGARFLAHRSH